MPSLSGQFSQMNHGDEISIEDPVPVKVRYESEQAMGDDNKPARGYTVGYYHVTGPKGTKSFRHSPHGPGLTGAKPYAAEQAASHVQTLLSFNDRRS